MMLTTRNVVLTVVAICVISLVWACRSLFMPLDSGGLGGDSYGTRRHGLRAMFDILTELDVPVERQLTPPGAGIHGDSTFVLWKPDSTLLAQEPRYLKTVANWLNEGGRVVIALEQAKIDTNPFTAMLRGSKAPESLFDVLHISGVRVDDLDLSSQESPTNQESEPTLIIPDDRTSWPKKKQPHPTKEEDLKQIWKTVKGERRQQPTRSMTVTLTGTLRQLGSSVKTLEVPDNLQVLTLGSTHAEGTVEGIDPWGETRILAAAFRVGQGELIVVSSPALAENRLIAHSDNGVLIVNLIAPDGRGVIVDEFYHGLTVRGNPLWLFTRPGFGPTSICLLAFVGLLIWRAAVFLGPPLAEKIPSRRSLTEYVTAMGLFLKRGKAARTFVLQEVRSGVLFSIRKEVGLPPSRDDVEDLAAVLKRRNPARAERLIDAIRQIDQALSRDKIVTETETIRLLQGISSCL